MEKISIVIPCYNEEEAIEIYFSKIDEYINKIEDFKFEFVLVNDGSKDKTLDILKRIHSKRDDVTIVNLSRNFGQMPAISAGLYTCKGDFAIIMDADLQDPLYMIEKIAAKFKEGYDVVNPHRIDRKKDSSLKRNTAGFFYKFVNKIEGKKIIPENVNCFRGLSRKAIDEILKMKERDRYLLAEIPYIGFKVCTIDFSREERICGKTKYNLKKMTRYALDNISAITSSPLYSIIKFGALSSLLTFVNFLVMLILFICSNHLPMNQIIFMTLFIVSMILLCSSIIIFFIGVIGVYLHNILINTRERENFIIDEVITPKDK